MNEWYGRCPFCKKDIRLIERKDFESFTNTEVIDHMVIEHEQILDEWYAEHPFGLPYIYVYMYTSNGDEIGKEPNALSFNHSRLGSS